MKIYKEFGRNPQLDWITILVLSIVIALGLFFVGFSLYNAVISGTIKGTETKKVAPLPKLNEKVISSVLEKYDEREAASAKARAGYTGQPDPSF